MLRWILLIYCLCWISSEARHLETVHGHHVSHHLKRSNNSPHHLHVKRGKKHSKSYESREEKNKNVCQTDACYQTAKFMKNSMDDTVDPCVDFEQYACGRWAENHEIPPFKSIWSTVDVVDYIINNQLKELLSKNIQSEDILPVKLSKKWYQSCINTDELDRKGLRPLLNVVARIGGWPMAMEPNEWDESSFPWQRVDKYYARLTGSITFAQSKVVPDYIASMFRENKKTTMTLQIEKMELPMMEEEYESRVKRSDLSVEEDYKRLVEETAVELAKERGVDVSREAIVKDVEDMLEFEKKLSRMLIRLPNDYDYGVDDSREDDNGSKSGENSDDSSNNVSDETSDGSSNTVSDEDSVQDSDVADDNSEDNNDSDSEDDENDSNNSDGNNSDDSDNNNNDSIDSISNDSDDSEGNDNDSNDSIADDSDDSEDFIRNIRKSTKKATKKRAKKYFRRRILSEYSDEDEKDESDLEEEEFWSMTLWGNSLKAILKEANVNSNDIDINDLITSSDLRKIYSLLEKTPKRVVVNYVHWKFINGMLRHTTEKLRRMYFNVTGKKFGKTEPEPRWLWCIQQIGMKDIVSYEYIKNYFPDDTKEMANRMIEKIRNVIEKDINESPWMSDELKKTSKEKLHAMQAKVGYPEWYDNSTAIEHYYKGLVINREYFENMLNFKKYNYIRKLRMMTSGLESSDWSWMSPLTMNAMYVPWKNSLLVTAANFHRPFFDKSQPEAVNFGIIGYTISHEISHGFDPLGRNFDKNGDWLNWQNEDEANYVERSKCYVEMYNNYTIELEDDNKTIRVDGKKTVGDNIADCMGLEAVHEAYRLWKEEQKDRKDLKLPGFEEFTSDQLFFLASASVWCEITTPQFAKFLAKMDEHSPNRARILGPISNNEHFGKAFNCPKGSPMNPENKCRIWK